MPIPSAQRLPCLQPGFAYPTVHEPAFISDFPMLPVRTVSIPNTSRPPVRSAAILPAMRTAASTSPPASTRRPVRNASGPRIVRPAGECVDPPLYERRRSAPPTLSCSAPPTFHVDTLLEKRAEVRRQQLEAQRQERQRLIEEQRFARQAKLEVLRLLNNAITRWRVGRRRARAKREIWRDFILRRQDLEAQHLEAARVVRAARAVSSRRLYLIATQLRRAHPPFYPLKRPLIPKDAPVGHSHAYLPHPTNYHHQLLTTCSSPPATCYCLLATCYSPPATCYMLLATCCLLLATCYSPPATCYLLLATCCLLLSTWNALLTTHYLLLVTNFLLLTTCY